MKTHHIVTIKEIKELENGDFNLIAEGFDAEELLDFLEIIHYVNGGQVRGLCLDPSKTKLSTGCRQLIKVAVLNAVKDYQSSNR